MVWGFIELIWTLVDAMESLRSVCRDRDVQVRVDEMRDGGGDVKGLSGGGVRDEFGGDSSSSVGSMSFVFPLAFEEFDG